MLKSELINVIPGITRVICKLGELDNPKYGWTDAMLDMVGITFTVREVLSDGVTLRHPDGQSYSFHYSILDMVDAIPYFETTIDNVRVSCINKLDAIFLERHCNYSDFVEMKKLFKTKKVLHLDTDVLNHIQQQHPRVIGAMLSNNKLKKVG